MFTQPCKYFRLFLDYYTCAKRSRMCTSRPPDIVHRYSSTPIDTPMGVLALHSKAELGNPSGVASIIARHPHHVTLPLLRLDVELVFHPCCGLLGSARIPRTTHIPLDAAIVSSDMVNICFLSYTPGLMMHARDKVTTSRTALSRAQTSRIHWRGVPVTEASIKPARRLPCAPEDPTMVI